MNNRILFFASALILIGTLASCTKKTAFTYKVDCQICRISYFDSDGRFVTDEMVQNEKEIQIEIKEFEAVQIAAQSLVCPLNAACDSALFTQDSIRVELLKGSELICTQSKSGEPLQAVSCTYSWPK